MRTVAASSGTNLNLGYNSSANQIRITGAVATQTASDSAFHSVGRVFNGASSVAVVDGSAGTAGSTSTSFSSNNLVLQNDQTAGTSGTGMSGYVCEVLITASAPNSTQYGALSTNARLSNRWGSSF
jgi:hypothetical protein